MLETDYGFDVEMERVSEVGVFGLEDWGLERRFGLVDDRFVGEIEYSRV